MSSLNLIPLPAGWRCLPVSGAVRLIAPSMEEARDWCRGAARSLQGCANRLEASIEIWAGDRQIRRISAEGRTEVSSTGPSTIAPDASYEAIADFISGKRAEGLIVTITSMVSDRCLVVNDLQILDRGGGWNIDNWVGLDFKNLWRDSFLAGRINYYAQLIQNLERDRHIPEFHYQIRRPAGELAEYSSTYYLINDYCGVPVRIAVSRVGDWQVIK